LLPDPGGVASLCRLENPDSPVVFQTRLEGTEPGIVAEAEAALAADHDVVIQFSRPTPDDALAAVDALAATAPDRVTLRFYDFYSGPPFDAEILTGLQHVRRFDLDCLLEGVNLDALGRITGITHLALEVWNLTQKDILHHIDPSALRSLRVGDMQSKAIDGSALARFRALETVWLSNSVKAHDGLRGLPALRQITLRARPKDSYAFLADCPALTGMSFFLGGAPAMEEVRSETLTDLSVIRCRGLDDMGDLGRFPALRHLAIEDQIRMSALDLSGARKLATLTLINCKTLARLDGLDRCPLRALWVHGTALDLDAIEMMPRDWDRLGLFSGRRREDNPRNAGLVARGFGVPHQPPPS